MVRQENCCRYVNDFSYLPTHARAHTLIRAFSHQGFQDPVDPKVKPAVISLQPCNNKSLLKTLYRTSRCWLSSYWNHFFHLTNQEFRRKLMRSGGQKPWADADSNSRPAGHKTFFGWIYLPRRGWSIWGFFSDNVRSTRAHNVTILWAWPFLWSGGRVRWPTGHFLWPLLPNWFNFQAIGLPLGCSNGPFGGFFNIHVFCNHKTTISCENKKIHTFGKTAGCETHPSSLRAWSH